MNSKHSKKECCDRCLVVSVMAVDDKKPRKVKPYCGVSDCTWCHSSKDTDIHEQMDALHREIEGKGWHIETIENLSAKLHDIYQKEAHRQEAAGIGPARHYDEYEKLSEPVKDFDRVLARYIISLLEKERCACPHLTDCDHKYPTV